MRADLDPVQVADDPGDALAPTLTALGEKVAFVAVMDPRLFLRMVGFIELPALYVVVSLGPLWGAFLNPVLRRAQASGYFPLQ